VRGSKVKKLRKMYRQWFAIVSNMDIPEGARLISFRVFRKRICAKQ
jgi:hypothetical protein